MITIYGINNCDKVKKAKKFLEELGFPTEIHDYSKDGITIQWLTLANMVFGLKKLINKQSTTYKSLSDKDKKDLDDKDKALQVILANPKVLKRPIIMYRQASVIGFDEKEYNAIFPAYAEQALKESYVDMDALRDKYNK